MLYNFLLISALFALTVNGKYLKMRVELQNPSKVRFNLGASFAVHYAGTEGNSREEDCCVHCRVAGFHWHRVEGVQPNRVISVPLNGEERLRGGRLAHILPWKGKALDSRAAELVEVTFAVSHSTSPGDWLDVWMGYSQLGAKMVRKIKTTLHRPDLTRTYVFHLGVVHSPRMVLSAKIHGERAHPVEHNWVAFASANLVQRGATVPGGMFRAREQIPLGRADIGTCTGAGEERPQKAECDFVLPLHLEEKLTGLEELVSIDLMLYRTDQRDVDGVDSGAAVGAEEICTICLGGFGGSDQRLSKMHAHRRPHIFHKTCLDAWVERCRAREVGITCPNCRESGYAFAKRFTVQPIFTEEGSPIAGRHSLHFEPIQKLFQVAAEGGTSFRGRQAVHAVEALESILEKEAESVKGQMQMADVEMDEDLWERPMFSLQTDGVNTDQMFVRVIGEAIQKHANQRDASDQKRKLAEEALAKIAEAERRFGRGEAAEKEYSEQAQRQVAQTEAFVKEAMSQVDLGNALEDGLWGVPLFRLGKKGVEVEGAFRELLLTAEQLLTGEWHKAIGALSLAEHALETVQKVADNLQIAERANEAIAALQIIEEV